MGSNLLSHLLEPLEIVPFDILLILSTKVSEHPFLGDLAFWHIKRTVMREDDFLMEVHRLAIELELLIDRYDLRDKVLSMMVVGVLDALEDDNEKSRMKAIYSHNMHDELELQTVIDFATETWRENKDIDRGLDFDDLFDGLGISLN